MLLTIINTAKHFKSDLLNNGIIYNAFKFFVESKKTIKYKYQQKPFIMISIS